MILQGETMTTLMPYTNILTLAAANGTANKGGSDHAHVTQVPRTLSDKLPDIMRANPACGPSVNQFDGINEAVDSP